MISMNLKEISAAIAAEVKFADLESRVTGKVVIDSRKVLPGDLFVAIKGENVDGHDFAAQAIKQGAVAVISGKEIPGVPSLIVTQGNSNSKEVDQPTVIALGKLAKYLLQKLPNLWKVAVTGSSGKTTTKDLLAELGKLVGPTVAPIGSYNNEIGLPQTVLECDENTKVLILEMGARQVGNIKHLCEIAKPDTSIILNIGTAHAEIFTSPEKIFQAKSEIIDCLTSTDVAILNHEDSRFAQLKTKAKVISFGLTGSNVSASNVILNENAQAQYELGYEGKTSLVNLKLIGAHQVSNSLAAAAAFLQKGIVIEDISKVLSNATPKSKWRLQIEKSKNNVTVINDVYNANPESTKSAIKTLKQIGEDKNTFAILGEMRELGNLSKQLHEEVAALIQKLEIKNTLVIGNGAKPIYDYLLTHEYSGKLLFVENVDSALVKVKEIIQTNDVVLVKASRSIGLERVANAIVQDFSDNLTNNSNQEVGL
jgi:UDP-N-acetylmuramoyl-tripeptide--D-alanyl-D-alanine ligase